MPIYLDPRDNLILVVNRLLIPVASVALSCIVISGIRVQIFVAENLRRGRAGLVLVVIAEEVVAALIVEINGVLGVGHGAGRSRGSGQLTPTGTV